MPTSFFLAQSEMMWRMFMQQMDPLVRRIIRFFRKLPEFKHLPETDKMDLVRCGTGGTIFLRFTRMLDVERDTMFSFALDSKIPGLDLFIT